LQSGKVLVAGGLNSNGFALSNAELYDPDNGIWTATGSLTTTRSQHTTTLLPNGKVLVAGGFGRTSAELYDPASGTWTLTGSLPNTHNGRYAHTATLLPNGEVLVAGGSDTLATAELYDSASGTWTATGRMVFGRNHHT